MNISPTQIQYLKTLAIISTIMLLLAIPPMWPYSYYQLLRWVVAGTAIFVAYLAHITNRNGWMWTMILTAVLFNPVIPFFLSKGTWVVIDLITAILFFKSLNAINHEN